MQQSVTYKPTSYLLNLKRVNIFNVITIFFLLHWYLSMDVTQYLYYACHSIIFNDSPYRTDIARLCPVPHTTRLGATTIYRVSWKMEFPCILVEI